MERRMPAVIQGDIRTIQVAMIFTATETQQNKVGILVRI